MRSDELKGDWALVTGASAGIGRELCVQLASLGINLAVVARRQALLEALAEELRARTGIEVLVLPKDLRAPNAASEVKSATESHRVRIRILCNNAAVGRWGRFEAVPAEHYAEMIRLNASSIVELCHYYLPDLTSFPSSVVINVSSAAALQPVPYMAVYAATKAFVASFSQALYEEWRDRGVIVKTLIPGPTDTEFDANAGAYESKLKGKDRPRNVARMCLEHIADTNPLIVPAKGTLRQKLFAALLPRRLLLREVGKMFHPPS